MSVRVGRKLVMPVMLEAAVLVSGCPADDTGDDDATVASASDVEASGSSSSGPAVDCAPIADQDCDADPSCAYYPEFGGCVLDCDGLGETMCNEVAYCVWFDTVCGFEPVA